MCVPASESLHLPINNVFDAFFVYPCASLVVCLCAAASNCRAQISPAKAALLLGEARATTVQQQAFAYYQLARDFAATKGVIIADTKFEFGVDAAGTVHIADEVLTPDSSRFWPAATYASGRAQDSFDKQFVRDYLESIAYDKATPVELPADVVAKTLAKYVEIFQILTGRAPEL
jgi:phosphoribosylaminoimidazole-succinocarboxamide synthase